MAACRDTGTLCVIHWEAPSRILIRMGSNLSRLSVEAATSYYTEYPPKREHLVQFLDFLIDGRPLRDLLEVPDDTKQPIQETTALREDHNWPNAAVEQLDRLLGVLLGDFDDGRIALLMCTACGDLACGAVSMELVQTPQAITWQRFGWQDGVTDEPQPWLFPEQSFTFDRTEYEHLLRSLRDRYRRLPPQEPPAPQPSVFGRLFRLFGLRPSPE